MTDGKRSQNSMRFKKESQERRDTHFPWFEGKQQHCSLSGK